MVARRLVYVIEDLLSFHYYRTLFLGDEGIRPR